MLTEKQKELFASLRVELIDLNLLASFYIRKVNRIAYLFQKTTRRYILEEFTAMRYMENGIILHLTNLDDDSSNYSFRAILKEVGKSLKDQKQIAAFKKYLDAYRKSINFLKRDH